MASYGVNLIRDKKLVRGLDYYNGTCFEIKCTDPSVMEVLGLNNNTCVAGGRYDYLSSKFGKNAPAIGWAAGIDRLAIVTDLLNQMPEKKAEGKVVLATIHQAGEQEHTRALRLKC